MIVKAQTNFWGRTNEIGRKYEDSSLGLRIKLLHTGLSLEKGKHPTELNGLLKNKSFSPKFMIYGAQYNCKYIQRLTISTLTISIYPALYL
jgi:hypothetical protein